MENERETARGQRRRPRVRRSFDTTIPSPCIAVCQINNDTNCCIGCFRSIDEIREWPIMTAEQKTEALARVTERKAETSRSQPTIGPDSGGPDSCGPDSSGRDHGD